MYCPQYRFKRLDVSHRKGGQSVASIVKVHLLSSLPVFDTSTYRPFTDGSTLCGSLLEHHSGSSTQHRLDFARRTAYALQTASFCRVQLGGSLVGESIRIARNPDSNFVWESHTAGAGSQLHRLCSACFAEPAGRLFDTSKHRPFYRR